MNVAKPGVVNWIWQTMAACSCNASIQQAKNKLNLPLHMSTYQFLELITLDIWKVLGPMKWIGSTFSKLYCYDSNDLVHMFLTLTCPSVYHNYAGVSQYANISQFIRCNILIQQNTVSYAALLSSLWSKFQLLRAVLHLSTARMSQITSYWL